MSLPDRRYDGMQKMAGKDIREAIKAMGLKETYQPFVELITPE